MMTDLNLELKKRFDLFHEADRHLALCIVIMYVESLELKTKTREQRIVILSKELQRLKQEANAFPRKDYVMFAHKPNCLYNVFFSHYLFHHCDEEPLVLKGLIIFEKLKCIARLLSKAKRKWPLFTYVDFSEGKDDILVYELDERPWGMSQDDYHKMLNCCIQQKGECVNFAFKKIRERFIERMDDSPQWMETVRSTIQLLDEVFQKDQTLTANQLCTLLPKVTGLLPGWLPDDMDEFHRLFYQFDPQKSFCHALRPQLIQLAYEQIREGRIAPVPVCCLSLIKFKKWLAAVLNGKIGLDDPPDSHDRLLVEKCYETNIGIKKLCMDVFKMQYPYGKFTREQYKSILLGKLKKCRMELKEFEFPEYFHSLSNRENPHDHFIDQCWLDSYLEDHSCEMGQAIVLHEMIRFYMGKLARIDQSLVNPTLDTRQMKKDFKVIISIMVPSPGIIERLWKAFDKFSLAANSQKPLLCIVEDLKDIIDEIFREAMKDLIDLLETQPGEVIETYAKKMRTELEQRSLITPEFGQGLDKYVMDLKRFSKLKMKCSPVQQSSPREYNETPYNDPQKQGIKTEDTKIVAFNIKNIKDNRILDAMNYLIKNGAIPSETTFTQFQSKFNNINGTDPIEWLASQGDLATFIKELNRITDQDFAPYNQHWNIAPECFVKKGGFPFDPKKLRCSKPTMEKPKFIKAARMLI